MKVIAVLLLAGLAAYAHFVVGCGIREVIGLILLVILIVLYGVVAYSGGEDNRGKTEE